MMFFQNQLLKKSQNYSHAGIKTHESNLLFTYHTAHKTKDLYGQRQAVENIDPCNRNYDGQHLFPAFSDEVAVKTFSSEKNIVSGKGSKLTLLEKKQWMKRRNKAWWADSVTMIEPNAVCVWTTADWSLLSLIFMFRLLNEIEFSLMIQKFDIIPPRTVETESSLCSKSLFNSWKLARFTRIKLF